MFFVVEFTDGNDVAVIPQEWLDGTSCAVWPPYDNTNRIRSACIARELPGDKWRSYPIRIMYTSGEVLFLPLIKICL